MKENSRTWILAGGVTAALALSILVFFMNPGIIDLPGLDGNDIGGGALTAVILWLVLRRRRPMTQEARIVLGVAIGVALLMGLVVFNFI